MVSAAEHDRLWQHEMMRRDMERRRGCLFPDMTRDQPDTGERTRLAMQSIPWALPPKKDRDDG